MWAFTDAKLGNLSPHHSSRRLWRAVAGARHHLNPCHWLRTWLRREAALTELYQLNERDLADMGITSGDLPAILDGTFRREV